MENTSCSILFQGNKYDQIMENTQWLYLTYIPEIMSL